MAQVKVLFTGATGYMYATHPNQERTHTDTKPVEDLSSQL